MTDESYLKLILDGQTATGVKVDRLSDTVAILGERMNSWEKSTETAQGAHEKCRHEVDTKIHDHEKRDFAEHEKLDKRIKPIEELHQQQSGQRNGLSLAWRVVIGVMGSMVTVLTILAFFNIGG